MKISHDWLTQFIHTDASIDTLSETLTEIGLEVEGVETKTSLPSDLEGIIIAEVQEVHPHPNADKLKVCKVFDGENSLQVVCGASNVKASQKVALATIGTTITFPDGASITIKKSKLRGEVSEGMLCAEDELGLSDNHEGIMVLDEMAPIGMPLKAFLDKNSDHVFEIGLTPNRSDAMSHYGVARDLHAGMELRNEASVLLPMEDSFDSGNHEEPTYSVEIRSESCKRYCLAHIKNVQVAPSPDWLQTRLRSIGLEPINNVVDITNYILHSYGQPLHAFDAQKVKGNTVIVGNNAKDTVFITLDGEERKLSSEDLMIQNGEQEPMCIAGVFGGMDSGVTENTHDIILESAYFDPVSVRKTAKRHGLHTDASFRFERGVDPEFTLLALKKASEMLVELGGGSLTEAFIDVQVAEPKHAEIKVRFEKINSLIGSPIEKETLEKIFDLLEIEILENNEEGFLLSIPPYRTDVTREADVIEEILRIYGYNRIDVPSKISFSLPATTKDDSMESMVSELLASNGFYEVLNNSLQECTSAESEVTLLNPLSKELSAMRNTLLTGILENIAFNSNRNQNNLRFFEWGKSYEKIKTHYKETPMLALAMTGNYYAESWNTQSSPTTFYQMKGMVQSVLEKLGIKADEEAISETSFSETLVWKVGKKTLATLGKVNSSTLKSAGVKQTVWYAELSVPSLKQFQQKGKFKLKPIPKYPGSRRDLALLLDNTISYQELEQTAYEVDQKILQEINLFDVYEGDKIPEGKKSYAMSFSFLDPNQTLKDTQIEGIMNKIIKQYELKFNAILRN